MSRKKLSDSERSAIVYDYAIALESIGSCKEGGGYVAPKDIVMLIEHRLRGALREGPCPECPTCSLAAALEESETIETSGSKADP